MDERERPRLFVIFFPLCAFCGVCVCVSVCVCVCVERGERERERERERRWRAARVSLLVRPGEREKRRAEVRRSAGQHSRTTARASHSDTARPLPCLPAAPSKKNTRSVGLSAVEGERRARRGGGGREMLSVTSERDEMEGAGRSPQCRPPGAQPVPPGIQAWTGAWRVT